MFFFPQVFFGPEELLLHKHIFIELAFAHFFLFLFFFLDHFGVFAAVVAVPLDFDRLVLLFAAIDFGQEVLQLEVEATLEHLLVVLWLLRLVDNRYRLY